MVQLDGKNLLTAEEVQVLLNNLKEEKDEIKDVVDSILKDFCEGAMKQRYKDAVDRIQKEKDEEVKKKVLREMWTEATNRFLRNWPGLYYIDNEGNTIYIPLYRKVKSPLD